MHTPVCLHVCSRWSISSLAHLVGVYAIFKSPGKHLGQGDGDTECDDRDDKGINYRGPNVLSNGHTDRGGTETVAVGREGYGRGVCVCVCV